MTNWRTCWLESTGLFSRSTSVSIFKLVIGSRFWIWLFLAMNRFSLMICSMPSRVSRPLFETSRVLRLLKDLSTPILNRFKQLKLMFRISKVYGKGHISSISLLARLSFLRNGNFCNSGTSCFSKFPFTSSSVKFLNLPISLRCFTFLSTNLKDIKWEGFLTSFSDLTGTVVFEELEKEEVESIA